MVPICKLNDDWLINGLRYILELVNRDFIIDDIMHGRSVCLLVNVKSGYVANPDNNPINALCSQC